MRSPSGLGRAVWDRAYLLLVVTTFVWGGNVIAGRLAVGEMSPMVITTLRWLIVVVVLFAWSGRTTLAEAPILWPLRWRLFAMGALGFTAFNAIFYFAAHHTTAINIGLIQGAMPALVMIGSVVAYGTRIRAAQVTGLVLALVGVAAAAARGSLDVLRQLDFNVGDVWMVVATLLYSGYTVALRTKPAVSPLSFFAAVALAAFLSSLPLLAWEVAAGEAIWPTTGAAWAILAFIGLAPSLVSQITFMRGVELIGPARAGLFVNLVPIFTAGLGVAVLGERFAPSNAIALALVLGGIALAEWGRGPAGA